MTPVPPPPPASPAPPAPRRDPAAEAIGRLTRRAFLVGGVAAAAGLGGWAWLRRQQVVGGIPWPLRQVHRVNEWVGRGLYSGGRLAPEFDPARAGEPMVNGNHGRPDAADPAGWTLTVTQPGVAPRTFRQSEAAALPRVEMTTEFKCIEGWSQVVTWSGVRLADFVAANGLGRRPDGTAYDYVALETADGAYYVGLDTPSALHPQTLLCDAMNGAPLTVAHGAPLRVVLTVKYGIKNIKWPATLRFQDELPADYWAERGYDWYSGL